MERGSADRAIRYDGLRFEEESEADVRLYFESSDGSESTRLRLLEGHLYARFTTCGRLEDEAESRVRNRRCETDPAFPSERKPVRVFPRTDPGWIAYGKVKDSSTLRPDPTL